MKDELRRHGVTPTSTRVRIWSYLADNTSHPTADDIYRALCGGEKHISRATVYNTLNLFAEIGLVRELHAADDVVHYDPNMAPHAHFQCRNCGHIWNIPYDEQALRFPELSDAQIDDVEIIIHGTCRKCLKQRT